MASSKDHALAVLQGGQIGKLANLDIKKIGEGVKQELLEIRKDERRASFRGIRLGLVLYIAKDTLDHGKFMPWVKRTFGDLCPHRTATHYMKLARYFVQRTKAELTEVKEIAAGNSSLVLDAGSNSNLVKKALKFIGDKTLTDLLAEASDALATERGSGDDEGGDDTTSASAAEVLLSENAEHIRHLKKTLLDPQALVQLTRKQREHFKNELEDLSDSYRSLHEQAFGKK